MFDPAKRTSCVLEREAQDHQQDKETEEQSSSSFWLAGCCSAFLPAFAQRHRKPVTYLLLSETLSLSMGDVWDNGDTTEQKL